MSHVSRTVFRLATVVVSAAPGASQQDGVDLRVASFEVIWKTVEENHFDPTFGGIDWTAIHAEYAGLVKQVEDDAGFCALANRMLGELGLSHNAVFRIDRGDPAGRDGTVGLDVRVLDGHAVVTSIASGGPAEAAGLATGCILERIDDVPVGRIMSEGETWALPDADARTARAYAARAVWRRLLGEPGTSASLAYRDGLDVLRQTTVRRAERPGTKIASGSLPPTYVEFEARWIAGDVAYVGFSPFRGPIADRFEKAIDEMMDARGLVLDIRGNPGGDHTIGEAIASKLVQEQTLFSVFRYRNRTKRVFVRPRGETFAGPVVVLVDGLTASASERFAACLQSIGRAVVVGERSLGAVGPARVKRLPNGASLQYLVAQSLTPDGTVLEGRGVVPDIVVVPTREALLAGEDPQLARAVTLIENGR